MPTILFVNGWRLFFFSNEGNEPPHIHAEKGGTEVKFWLRADLYNIEEAYAHALNPKLRREIRKIVFDHFEYLVEQWQTYFGTP